MSLSKTLRDLGEGKTVQSSDYYELLQTGKYLKILNALENRYRISKNPKTILEIFRLSSLTKSYGKICNYKDIIYSLKENMELSDYCSAITQIMYAENNLKNMPKKRAKIDVPPPDYDDDRFLYVHHDNEPYINR